MTLNYTNNNALIHQTHKTHYNNTYCCNCRGNVLLKAEEDGTNRALTVMTKVGKGRPNSSWPVQKSQYIQLIHTDR